MDYNRINNLTGWGIFALAWIVYLLTMAPTASFWDCGEFIACANELEVPHPPGAPFFLILGRVFAIFAGTAENVPVMLNILSTLCAAFTILFTFWITTFLAKRLIAKEQEDGTLTSMETLMVMGAGVIGAAACTFADSVWFNAVEAEVYAMSSLFTAVVVWLMFKWHVRADQPGNERWIILIAYLMGLSIGVHLLNLLTIPALAFIYYFRKYDFSWRGFIVTGLISVIILGVIQTGIILYTFDIAWAFEKFLVGTTFNNGSAKSGLGMPVGSGILLWMLILIGGLIFLTWYSAKNKKPLLNLATLCAIVIYIGFSSYAMIPIRSNANPAIDENNPDNSYTFLRYMKREQYGDRPLLRGPLYNASPVAYKDGGMEYYLDDETGKYRELGTKRKYEYNDKDKKWFPRMYYDQQMRWRNGPHAYVNYVRRKGSNPNDKNDDRPTAGEDFNFFLDYQVGHMYVRYFLWNFAGRQGDVQDMGWESGLNVNEVSNMPASIKNDPGKNHFFMLPLILGLLGLYWQAKKRGQDAVVIGLLFFFTGLAIVIYLNQYPSQPRERDYSFAGSFQTFAIWIGLGAIALYDLLKRYAKGATTYIALGVGIIPPVLMAAQGWDDHSRAGRYLAPDSAYNLLNSLAPNAILFTNGDNDTFPLWYIQEVENVRPDVRVLCLSYVNTDWYIDQMYQKLNESEPLPLTLKQSQYYGQKNQGWDQGSKERIRMRLPADISALKANSVITDREEQKVQSPMVWDVPTRGGGSVRYLELKDRVVLNLVENISKGGWDRPIYFANTVSRSSYLGLDKYLRLEGMAYRVTPVVDPLPADPYDFYVGGIEPALMENNITEKFRYRNLNNPKVYYDENSRRTIINYQSIAYRLANYYYREAEKLENTDSLEFSPILGVEGGSLSKADQISTLKTKAKELMDFTEENFPLEVINPGPFFAMRNGVMYERLGETEKAQEYMDATKAECIETLKFYRNNNASSPREGDFQTALRMLYQHYLSTGKTEEGKALLEELDAEGLSLNQ
ncbi:MAG: DUF2723 domain-containing protein [Bacteroidota bacterium]